MSCWVVPSLAAELWRIPLAEVMRRMDEGLLPFKQEDGFTFIDVAPDSPQYTPTIEPVRLPPELRPPTFVSLSPDELAALESADEVVLVTPIEATVAEETPAAADEPNEILMLADPDPEDSGADQTESVNLGDWRSSRRQTGRLRIPPPRRLSA